MTNDADNIMPAPDPASAPRNPDGAGALNPEIA